MRGGKRERIEKAVDIGAATALAAAVAFSLYKLLPGTVGRPYFNLVDACLGVVAFLLSFRFLRGLGSKAPDFELRLFELPQLSFDEPDELLLTQQVELLLTDADRVKPPRSTEEELVLNDILAKLGPQSRVVRLFDPAAMPTPAQLNDRIERHLRGSTRQSSPADASEALYQALNELRRSLR
jgi:hypothetical protein